MLLALRSLWEEQQSGVVTGTMAVTAAPGTSAATATTTSESRLVGGKKRKLPIRKRGPRIAQWSEAVAPLPKPERVIVQGRSEVRGEKSEVRCFGAEIFAGMATEISGPGYSRARGEMDMSPVERDEAFMALLLAA